MAWDIDAKSGYCKSSAGIELILASANPDQIYTPILGPFTVGRIGKFALAHEIAQLIHMLEKDQGILLFGSLTTEIRESEIIVQGRTMNWIPDPSARTHWLLEARDHCQLWDEWENTADRKNLRHRSGISFELPSEEVLDGPISLTTSKPIKWTKGNNFNQFAWPNLLFECALHSLSTAAIGIGNTESNQIQMPRLLEQHAEYLLNS